MVKVDKAEFQRLVDEFDLFRTSLSGLSHQAYQSDPVDTEALQSVKEARLIREDAIFEYIKPVLYLYIMNKNHKDLSKNTVYDVKLRSSSFNESTMHLNVIISDKNTGMIIESILVPKEEVME